MPDCSHLYHSAADNVKADDLDDRAWTLTISRAAPEDCSGKNDTEADVKVVVEFKETSKRFPLNWTNWTTISDLHGADPDHWTGRQIVLYPTETDSPRGRVPCIRCRRPDTAPADSTPPRPAPSPPSTTLAATAVMTGAELAAQQAAERSPASAADPSLPF